MSFRFPLLPIAFIWIFQMAVSEAVVREENLLVRWTFDETNGTTASDSSGNGVDARLSANNLWGNGKSKGGLDLSAGTGYADAGPHPNLQARVGFSYALWFKPNGIPADWTQILAKREGSYSPFFVQVDSGGATFKTFYRFLTAYIDNGAYPITPGDWHFLVTSYDGAKFKTYLNGVLMGSSNQTSSVTVDNGELGIGAAPDGSNIFNGWIDDVRFYDVALSADNVDIAYNDGFGDFGPKVDFNVSRASNVLPIPASITFKDKSGNPVGVTDFDLSDLTIQGATAHNLVVDSNSTYSFELNATRDPQRIYLTVNAGAVQDGVLDYNQKNTVVITYNDKVTRSADLVGWWSFDEFNGTDLVADQSGGDAFASLQGGALLETVSPKFGTGSLLLDGVDDWAEVSSLMPPTKITRFDDLEGWWPLDGNTSDMSGNFRDGTIGGQSEWTGGRMGQAFKLTGNDHIVVNGYKGISGTSARTLSLWFKTQNASWRTLAYWGSNSRGQRWWLRLNGNDFRIDFNGATRNTTEFKLNNGIWHNVVTVLREGGNDRSSPVFYIDGKKTTVNGQWGGQNQLNTGNATDFSIGKRWDNGQRFIGSIDDVRLYSVAFSDFEVEMLYGEAKGSPLDLGEGNYTISVWAKPSTILPPFEYDFATAWYEGNGGDWMQVRMGQGLIPQASYNNLSIFNSGDPQQAPLFPQGVTERIFDGSFNDNQLDPIDSGSGFLEPTRSDHVHEDTAFDLPIDFNAGAVDARSGGATGSDTVGGVWFGKLRIGNTGFIRSGAVTFGTRSDDGSVFWLDLDRNGVFSTNGSKGSELIVNNKGGHGQRNRVGTALLGFNAPLLLRSGLSANKGITAGIEGYSSVSHATQSEGLAEISSLPMVQDKWHHLASVVDKDAGSLRHYLNGALVAESFFGPGESGETTLGDWFLGGMPSLDRFHGLLDDARVYSVALTDAEISKIYNGGEGDMGLVGVFTAPAISNAASIPVTLQFQRYEEAVAVTGLDASDLSAGVSGATITGFSSADGITFTFNLVPDANATTITLDLAKGAGSFSGDLTLSASMQVRMVPPVQAKNDLVNWWWLDEGRGSSVQDSIYPQVGETKGQAGWSTDSMFGTSLSFQQPGDYADLGPISTNWVNDLFSLSFWFKRSEEGFSWSGNEVSNVMISLSGAAGSTLELGTKGGAVELYMNSLGRSERTLLGSSVTDGQWHYLTLAYDANATSGIEMEVFLDGASIGSTNRFGGPLLVQPDDRWYFGLADPLTPAAGRYLGKLDDLRFFSKALSLSEHQVLHNDGSGDLSLTVVPSYPVQTHSNPISIDLNFWKYGQPWPVEFNATRSSASNNNLYRNSASDWLQSLHKGDRYRKATTQANPHPA